MPVGSAERAIPARTAGVVRASGWIASIRPSLQPRALARGPRSATRTPRSPDAPGPNNVPPPNKHQRLRLWAGWGRSDDPAVGAQDLAVDPGPVRPGQERYGRSDVSRLT